MNNLRQLLKVAVDQGASDVHITIGSPPQLRIDGSLVKVRAPDLDAAMTKELCYALLTDEQKSKFEETKELDFSFGIKGLARFRANTKRFDVRVSNLDQPARNRLIAKQAKSTNSVYV